MKIILYFLFRQTNVYLPCILTYTRGKDEKKVGSLWCKNFRSAFMGLNKPSVDNYNNNGEDKSLFVGNVRSHCGG